MDLFLLMSMKKTILYSIPVGEKFLLYAPLKPLAFIGNHALVERIYDRLQHPSRAIRSTNKVIGILKEVGLFEPDQMGVPTCESYQPFHPALCILMPTTACNLACTYCYAGYDGKKKISLTWPVAKKAIDIAFENSVTFKKNHFALSFHGGGEPTLAKNLFLKASEYARKLDPDCPISVTTNAVWDKEFRNVALNFLSEISLSFDGDEITQNRQRPDSLGKGTFSRVMETIRDIEKRNIPYGIRMTVTKESLHELRSNIEFMCNQTTCDSFQIEPVYNQGRALEAGFSIDDSELFVEIFMDVYHLAKERGKLVHYSSARPHLITDMFCTATSNALIVTSHGELTACYEVFDHSHVLADDFIIGRIDVKDGVILYPGKRENLLGKIAVNKSACKNCFCYYHCAGDCPPKAFLSKRNNDHFRCTVTKEITKELILDQIIENNGFWKGERK